MRTPVLTVALALSTFLSLTGSTTSAARQQTQPTATGIIAGTLSSSDLGRPIRKATVTLTSVAAREGRTTVTDAEGRFVFEAVPPGDYSLSAAKPGYLEMTLGARRPGPRVPGIPLTLAAGQKLDQVALSLPRGSVIAGTVTDEFGDPAMGVSVRALRFGYMNGHRITQPAGNATSDDLGGYRIPGLMPGEYVVAAVPRDTVANASANADANRARLEQVRAAGVTRTGPGRVAPPINPDGYVPSYFGGTASASGAAKVRLSVGEHANATDIQLISMKTGKVSGLVTTPDGASTMASVQLVDPEMPIAGLAVWFRNPGANGRFSFDGLIPGSYVLRAQATKSTGAAGDGVLSAVVSVQVPAGGDVDAPVTLKRGVSVSGVLDVTSLPSPADRTRVRVQLDPIAGPADWELPLTRAAVDAEGRFTISRVAPGAYRISLSGLPPGWSLESASFGSIDAADVDLDVGSDNVSGGVVRLTSRTGELAGVVTNTDNEPVVTHSIVLFPSDRELWLPQSRRINITQPGADGRYVFRGVPAGEYRVAAVDPPEGGEHFSAEYLARISSFAVNVTLAAGVKTTQDLRVR